MEVTQLPVQQERAQRINEKLRRELGPVICEVLRDPTVIEIMLNPDGRLWVEYLGGRMQPLGFMPPFQAEALMATIASTLKTTITRENPILECELPLDGSRFEGLIPPVVVAPTFAIRRKALSIFTLEQYVTAGIMTDAQRLKICASVDAHHNILIAGGTGSGKTTLANAILDYLAKSWPEERPIVIEDTAEIQVNADNVVILRAVDGVDMLRLLKASMRLRPSRIIVGEVRGSEALALIKAWNTGHPGGVATVHANDAQGALIRLESLVAEATFAPMQQVIAEAVNVVISIAKTPQGRRVQEVLTVIGYDGSRYQILSSP
jgi:P-type conjugative transfer ATPase TrbB